MLTSEKNIGRCSSKSGVKVDIEQERMLLQTAVRHQQVVPGEDGERKAEVVDFQGILWNRLKIRLSGREHE